MWPILLLIISHQGLAEILLYFPGEPRPLDTLRDIPSSFGDVIPSTGLAAEIVYASPADGCDFIQPPPWFKNITHSWVALVSRNNCSFELKIRNAQNSNYKGVIVHNVGSDNILEMYVENATGIYIPSVFIGEDDGFYLRRTFALHDLYYIIITPDYPFNYSYLFLLVTGIGIIVFFIIVLSWVISSAAHHYKQNRQTQIVSSIKQLLKEHEFRKGNPYKELTVSSDNNIDDYIKREQHT